MVNAITLQIIKKKRRWRAAWTARKPFPWRKIRPGARPGWLAFVPAVSRSRRQLRIKENCFNYGVPFANSRACTLMAMLRSSFLRVRNAGATPAKETFSRIYVHVLCAFSPRYMAITSLRCCLHRANVNPACAYFAKSYLRV